MTAVDKILLAILMANAVNATIWLIRLDAKVKTLEKRLNNAESPIL